MKVPFELSTGTELFLQEIDKMFEGEGIAMLYFDDILVASRTPNEHVAHVQNVLTIARDNNLKLNCEKLKLGISSVTNLGHQLARQDITPDPDKVKAINAIPVPIKKAELLRVMGMATYLMNCVPNFSAKTRPLRELLKFDVVWHWSPKMSGVFNKIK